MIDLHSHTNYSDGELSPTELVARAAERGVTALSITDHDTIEPYSASLAAFALGKGVTLVPGIELSTVDAESKEKIHVLGLNIDTANPELLAACVELRTSRERTMLEVAEKLAPFGLTLRHDELLASGEIITKAHIARDILANSANHAILVAQYGELPLQGTFIEDYLIKGCPAFVEKDRELATDEAVDLIHLAQGKAFCAHPSFNIMRGLSFEAMKSLVIRNKFDGVEAINVQYDKSHGDKRFDMVHEFTEFAHESNLLVSGGSDYHSDNHALWGAHTELGFANEPLYEVTPEQLAKILA